ncbi:DUF1993 domain-containing protein [Rhizobium alvei]|uniref:DUF1993 domain-containing protein n=1 Tax=Rhizobium alvei TaxID=1132659 RepID=A0ABT8YQ28_9HYPH|nr:DUF1993 domain-containing protein [Rhizobium alvei]MDO6965422.1 DUF1993 domain-containing protein [Rhizobium alvei]
MTISLHSVAARSILPRLKGLSEALASAEAHCATHGIDPALWVQARLAPDMYPLARQVQIASDHAKGCLYRIAGLDVPALADTETTFAELRDRIARTVDLFEAVDVARVNGRDDMMLEVRYPWGTLDFTSEDFLVGWVMPNFYFHVTTAYDILRHLGLPLGKPVFMGRSIAEVLRKPA